MLLRYNYTSVLPPGRCVCPLCGSPDAEVIYSKRDKPVFRCIGTGCLTTTFINTPRAAASIAAWMRVANAPDVLARTVPARDELVALITVA